MKTKKLIYSFIIAISTFLLITNNVFADNCLMEISDECLNASGNNSANTASFDATSNTLTLNNFEGEHIKFTPDEEKTLKIILKGTNKISDNTAIPGINTEYSVIIESAEGEKSTLNIENLERGINSNGNVTINNVNLNIKDTTSNAIISGGEFKTTNSNITINNAGKGSDVSALTSSAGITIDSNLNISNVDTAIETDGLFTLNKGKVIVDASYNGVISYTGIKINGGYIETTVNDGGVPIAAVAINEEPIFEYKDTMVVTPSDASIKTSELEVDPDNYILKTLGYEGLSFDLSFTLTSGLNHVIIQDTYKVTFDPNGGTGTMDELTDQTGTFNLPENEFTAPKNMKFKGWSLTKDGETLTSLELTEDVTFYAIWEEVPTTTTKTTTATKTSNNQIKNKNEKEENPATGDNVLLYTIVGIISLTSLSSGIIYIKKNN